MSYMIVSNQALSDSNAHAAGYLCPTFSLLSSSLFYDVLFTVTQMNYTRVINISQLKMHLTKLLVVDCLTSGLQGISSATPGYLNVTYILTGGRGEFILRYELLRWAQHEFLYCIYAVLELSRHIS